MHDLDKGFFMNWDNAGQTRWLPSRLHSLLERALEDGELVVWFEQPDARRWRRKGYAAVPFGLAVLAFVLHAAPQAPGGWYWLIGTLPALLLVVLPWLMDSSARSTLYVITNRRALILTAGSKDALRSYPVQQLPELLMRRRVDGSGDLILETEHFEDSDGDPQTREHGFEDIREVGLVQHILENLALGKDPVLVRRHAALWRVA